jgi:hypothetical protein
VNGKEMQPEDHVYVTLRVLLEDFYAFIIQVSSSSPFQMVPSLYQRISEHASIGSLMIAVARDEDLAKFFPALREETDGELDVNSIMDLLVPVGRVRAVEVRSAASRADLTGAIVK